MQVLGKTGTHYTLNLIKSVGVDTYLNLLQQLHQKGVLGKLAIYPALGVDSLIAQHTKVVGLNFFFKPYLAKEIIKHLSPIFPAISSLRSKIEENLTYFTQVDVSSLGAMMKTIGPYQEISPKSMIIKGLVESAFLNDWDKNNERFYPVSSESGQKNAECWLKHMTDWLKSGDTVIVFDRNLFSALIAQTNMIEVKTGLRDHGKEHDFVYKVRSIPIILLPHFARVFRKV